MLGFRLALPPLAGARPPAVYVLDDAFATVIVRAHDRSLLLSQFRSSREA